MNTNTTSLADYAVEAARERFGKSLDYSEITLSNLENLIELAINRVNEYQAVGKPVNDIINRTANIWGSYLGEVIHRELGGNWVSLGNETLLIVNGLEITPIEYVRQRLTNVTSQHVHHFYSYYKQKILLARPKVTPIVSYATPKLANTKSFCSSGTTITKSGAGTKGNGCLIAVIVVVVLAIIGAINSSINTSTSSSSPRELTASEEDALRAVKSKSTIVADDMVYSVAVILALIEADGHRTSVDGWYVSSDSDTVSVYFYLDGKREFAEWEYYPSGTIIAKNFWAFTFQGE